MTDQGMHEELRDDASPDSDIDVVLVTGLSGAGRGTAAKVLEDLGWYVADNLPPELIARMVELGLAASNSDALRLVRQGGVRIDDRKVDPDAREITVCPGETRLIKVGKRRFARVTFS